jgi:hypothetical protein
MSKISSKPSFRKTWLTMSRIPKSALATSIFKVLSAADIASGLHHWIEAFWCDERPFNHQVKDVKPPAWWEFLQDHPHDRVVAVSFAFLVSFVLSTIIPTSSRHQHTFCFCQPHV